MPFVQIHCARAVTPAARRALGFALARAYGEFMQTNRRIVNIGFVHYAENDLARYDAVNDGPQEMTIVTADIRAGRDAQTLEGFGRAITVLCARELGVSEARVAVYLRELPAAHIYRDGGRAPDWSAAEGAAPASD